MFFGFIFGARGIRVFRISGFFNILIPFIHKSGILSPSWEQRKQTYQDSMVCLLPLDLLRVALRGADVKLCVAFFLFLQRVDFIMKTKCLRRSRGSGSFQQNSTDSSSLQNLERILVGSLPIISQRGGG